MRPLFAVLVTILVAGPVVAEPARRPAVIDQAKLFSPAAVERANLLVAAIREQYGIDLVVDTIEELPGQSEATFRSMRTSAMRRLYHDVALDRADNEGVDGIYFLVTTKPRYVVVVGWPPARRESEDLPLDQGGGLSTTKRETKMRQPFVRELGDDPDAALLRLVYHFRAAVKERLPPPPSPLGTFQAAILVGVMFGAWVALMLLQRAVARRQATATGEPCRSLYQPAMLGSLFGVPAGFWIYDRLFRSERPPAGTAVVVEPLTSPEKPPVTEESPAPVEVAEGANSVESDPV
jgi:hypothetical protein